MKQTINTDDMRPDYDFSGGVRGKHYKAYQKGTNLVLLEPEVAKVFRDSNAVNRALRMLIELANGATHRALNDDGRG